MAFKKLAGRVTLVTGAARGIGRAIATTFVEHGAPVALCDIDEAALGRTADDLSGRGARVEAYRLDVTDAAAFADVFARVEHDLGPVDVLVNNAGIMPVGPFLELDPAVDRKQIEINLFGVIHGMRVALPRMGHRRRGHIVNIASSAGKAGIPNIAVYCGTKHAVIGLTEAVRIEMRGTGIDFTYVMPALVDTELTAGTGRMIWPPLVSAQDVADAVVRAVRSGQVDVFVPRGARLATVLPVLLPRAVVECIARLLHLDRIFTDEVDDDARRTYRDRVFGGAR